MHSYTFAANAMMFKRLIKVFSPVVILLMPFSASCQSVWKLQDCVEYALKNNLQLRQSQLNRSIAEAIKQQSFFNFFPTLNGSASFNYNSGRSVDPFTNAVTTRNIQSASFSLTSGITLFNGFQLQHQYQQSRLNLRAAEYDLEKMKNDITLNVVAAYLQVIYTMEELQSARDRVDLARQYLSRTRRLVEQQILASGSVLEAEAQLANEEYSHTVTLNSYQNALLALAQWMNLDPDTSFKIEIPEIEIPSLQKLELTPEMIYQQALKRQPEIRSAELRTSAARHNWSMAAGGRMPRLTFFASLSTLYSNQASRLKGLPLFLGYQPTGSLTASGETVLSPSYQYEFEKIPFSDQVDNNLSKSFGFNLSIPVMNGRSTEMAIKRARLNYESTRISQQIAEDQLYKTIQQAHQDAFAALNKFESARKSVEAQQQAMQYMEKKYEVGLVTSLEFFTARNNLTRAQTTMLQSRYDLIFKLKVLDFYAGQPLFNF